MDRNIDGHTYKQLFMIAVTVSLATEAEFSTADDRYNLEFVETNIYFP